MIPTLSAALSERGYDTLTPVQQAVTADDIGEEDLLVSAQTGSGKTVGFGLAVAPTLLGEAERFGPAATPLALVVAPTRELAFQVMEELRWLYAKTGAMVTACVGGMEMRQERRMLERGTHIVVGTPGRLCDHLRRGSLDLSGARAVVLDEADEMLDLGFREDLEFILQNAPEERRTLLFSATVSPAIAKMAETFQRDAKRINTIGKAEQHSDISYSALRVAGSDSDHAIFNLLRFHGEASAIVFANTRAAVAHLTTRLANRGLPVVSLSGELSQSERSHALQAMRDGRARICVATDVAARGIDLPNLNLVIHADLPTNTESLLHRSGRTGRAGRKGISALIVPPKMVKRAERLLKWAKIRAEWTAPPSVEDIRAQDQAGLMEDASWTEEASTEDQGFAAALLERYGPEAVAQMLVRQHLSRFAAPEELQNPDAPRAKPAKDFGPSRWFSLSKGRADRAEPRWLLPMVLRATGLEKSAIGAIRVQETETFVEIAEGQAEIFRNALGDDGTLADDIKARLLETAPDLSRPAPKPHRGKPGGKPSGKPSGKPRKFDSGEAPRKPKPSKPASEAPRKPSAVKPAEGAESKPRKSKSSAPSKHRDEGASHAGSGKPKYAGKPKSKSAPRKPDAKGKPARPARSKPGLPRGGDALPKRKR